MNRDPYQSAALLDTIRSAGFNISTARLLDTRTGKCVMHVDATSTAGGESFIVHAPTEGNALMQLAQQIGVAITR